MRVFSKEKFLEDNWNREFYFNEILSVVGENNWVNLLNGLTEEQIKMLGYAVVEEGMIEYEKVKG